jgi:disulfide bond formation protein DsbB
MKIPFPRRICYALGFIVATSLIVFALYLQQVKGEEPCPLCIFQRVAMTTLGLVFLLGTIHDPQSPKLIRLYAILGGGFASLGAAIAARQVWLQHLPPDQVPSCGPGLNYILKAHPFFNALQIVLKGSGECAVVGWQFAGLAISEWSLLWFLALGLWAIIQSANTR